jgi:hypothetical protein
MKNKYILMGISFILFSLQPVYAQPESIYGMVSFVSGESYLSDSSGNKQKIKIGMKVMPENRITTTDTGIIRVQIADVFICHIEKNSTVIFQEILNNTSYDNLNIVLKKGQIMAKLLTDKEKIRKAQLTVFTPSVTAGVRGTSFMVSESETGNASEEVPSGVFVTDGEVSVESSDGKFKLGVSAGEQAVLQKEGLLKSILEDAYAMRMKILDELKIMKEYNCKLIDEQKEKNRQLLEEMK